MKGAKQAAAGRNVVNAVLTPTPVKLKLNSIEDVRREMASIYREAKSGKRDISDTGRLAYILTGIGKLLEVETIERRIQALEDGRQSAPLADDVEYREVTNEK